MATKEIHIERLLGRRVFVLNGRSIGRLEEIRAGVIKNQCYVNEFLVGSYAMFESLAALRIVRAMLTLFNRRKDSHGYRVRWDQLDLSNPEQPRLRCNVSDLAPLKD